MGAFQVGSVNLASGTGTKTFTHAITGLTANPSTANAFCAILNGTTAAPGYTVTAIGSTTVTVSATATNTGDLFFHLGIGVRAVQL